MNKKTEKQTEINSRRKTFGDSSCFSVSLKVSEAPQKGYQKLVFFKGNMVQKNHQGTEDYSAESSLKAFLDLRKSENYGACTIAGGNPNCFRRPRLVYQCHLIKLYTAYNKERNSFYGDNKV